MATTVRNLLQEIRSISRSERDKGKLFERLIKAYFQLDPQYSEGLSDVWLWEEWPFNNGKTDTGIDLVARERDTGAYWAIQCKFFDPDHTVQKSDIDSFFTASGRKFTDDQGKKFSFAQRVIVSTTDKWSKHAEEALADQTIPVFRIGIRDLEESPIDWELARPYTPEDLRLRRKKTLRGHQIEALEAVREGFCKYDRGKLIMACGTGKTFTSLKIAEDQTPNDGLVLFLAPSISLVSQTLREWTTEASDPIHAFVVCSDSKVGRDNEDIPIHDLAYPATTDASKLREAVSAANGRRRVIFSTYQSIDVIAKAQGMGLPEFDLIICDEAHRTTGLTLPGEDASDFVKVHDNNVVRGKKRLYMTATPRIYGDASKSKANEHGAVLYSMDDEKIYGPEFYRLDFGKAVLRGLLTDYKVLIVAVDQERMGALANAVNKVQDKHIDIDFAKKIIGSWKGLSKKDLKLIAEDHQEDIKHDPKPMRRAVAFSSSIKASKEITEAFNLLTGMYLELHQEEQDTRFVRCELEHVDGSMNALVRQSKLDWLKEAPAESTCRILSNARCLSEGIDVPALDAVIFFDTRESIVDIVQSVGRVMRKTDGKEYGYIILPVAIPLDKTTDLETLNRWIESDPQFKGIWKVLKALRAHDKTLVDEAEFRRKIKVIRGTGGGEGTNGGGDQLEIQFPELPIDRISEAVYAAIPKKLGDREYWSEWAKETAKISEKLIVRIKEMLKEPSAREAMDDFLDGLRRNINPAITEDEAVEMLAQHIITRPVFEAIFEDYSFTANNPVSQAMQSVVEELDARAVDSETSDLKRFYQHIRERVALAKSDKSKQEVIRNLYDTFFRHGFPKMADRLGIVYTPVEVVDFIIKSADVALRKHFNASLSDRSVQILDPFAGTGTFIVRLLQSGLIRKEDFPYKYQHEIHANEIVLLAYYIAAINIESTYHALTGEYKPFEGIVLTDTFQMTEDTQGTIKGFSEENSERVNRQKRQDIRVIIGNPPYSAGQTSENDQNQNLKYPHLDERIKETYDKRSSARLRTGLYDSYIRAIRWASDRIKDQGIVAFVTNGSFIDSNVADGLRKCLVEEFSHLYVFNLRGNARTSGEDRRKEAGNVFGEGTRTPVAITLMLKVPDHPGPCELYYHDIGDYLSREQKLAIIENAGSIEGLEWQRITPNEEGDWINQRDPAFDRFIALGDKSGEEEGKVVFKVYSSGVKTNRDAWVYNFSRQKVAANMRRMIDAYNEEVEKYKLACKGLPKEKWPKPQDVVDFDPKRINWDGTMYPEVVKGRKGVFSEESIRMSLYRPFTKEWLYFDRMFNNSVYQMLRLFPTPEHENVVISVTGIGAAKPFSALVTDAIPNLHLHDTGQCFPMYWYEKMDKSKNGDKLPLGFGEGGYGRQPYGGRPDEHGYVRHEAITDWALEHFRGHYRDESITKEDIFWYVYGVLHSPEYRSRFASNLKKQLARIPLAGDFWAFSRAGRELGDLHLNYENVEPWPVKEEITKLIMENEDWRVTKMRFGKKGKEKDKTVIIYNGAVKIVGIPLKAYEYQVNGKSAIEWIMDRYQVKTDRASGIVNDPNEWSDDPQYIVELLRRVIRVSMESVEIIENLPPLGI